MNKFDYAQLDGKARGSTQQDAKAIRDLLEKTGAAVVEIGRRLQAVHDRIGGVKFQAWLRGEFRWAQSVASNYMRAAATFGDVDCAAQFQPSALFELSRRQVPPGAVARCVEEARAGETVTRRRAQEVIASLQSPDAGHTPLSRDALRRLRHSLNQMGEQLDVLVLALAPEDLDGLVDQLFDMAARLRAARKPAPSPRKPTRRRELAAV